jgi:predicted helicase
MNHPKIYGHQIYNYSFKKAIEDGYILDYKIISYVVPPGMDDIIEEKFIKKIINKETMEAEEVTKEYILSAIQLINHIKEDVKCRKILTYHNSVAKANQFKKILNYVADIIGIHCNIFIMSGKTKINDRSYIFDEFGESTIGIICSARVLNEGVDLPIVDTVMFVDPRSSTIDVTQCVGRANRLCPERGLTHCNIIIPIHYDQIKAEHQYSNVIKILTAMGEIDDKIVEYFISNKRNTKINIKVMNMVGVFNILDLDEIKYDVNDCIKGLENKILSRGQLCWDIKKELLFEYCDENKCVPTNKTIYKGQKIGK